MKSEHLYELSKKIMQTIFWGVLLFDGNYASAAQSAPRSAPKTVEIRMPAGKKGETAIPIAQAPRALLLVGKLSPVPCPGSCEKLIVLIEKGDGAIPLFVMTDGIDSCLAHMAEHLKSYKAVVGQFLQRNLREYREKLTQDYGDVNASFFIDA